MSTDLRTELHDRLDAIAPRPGDVARARRDGTRLRRRRRATTSLVGVAAAAVVAVGVTQLVATSLDGSITNDVVEDYADVGPMDFSDGLRAYADPGQEIHLGGRTFDASELDYLDTDATATPYGVVFYDRGRPMLLDETGEVSALVEGPVDADPGFHPTAKADSAAPHVAWAVLRDGTATITVRDMATGDDVDTLEVDCGDCAGLVIDALDGGVVLFRTGDGTRSWQVGDTATSELAGPRTRVADLRNGTLLYDGPPPLGTGPQRYLMVPGPVDAQLTFDGRYVLYWSSVLEPVDESDEPVRLEVGPARTGALGFWTIDTDGSVLVAALDGKYPNYLVSDCEVPSGACVDVGPLTPTGGDPMFIGNDM